MSKRSSNEADSNGRRLIEDLINNYIDHPEFRDIYVEGRHDQARVRWFLGRHNIRHVTVYEIDSVHIPMDVLKKYNLEDGQKGRIVAFAHEIEGKIPNPMQVTCIGDSDYDILLNRQYQLGSLVLTEYSCHEMYAFNHVTLEKFLAFSATGCSASPQDIIARTAPAMTELHLVRAANQSLEWGMEWVESKKSLSYKSGSLRFDADNFIQRYLQKNSRIHREVEFREVLSVLRSKLQPDHRFHISKIDFFTVMAFFLNKVIGGNSWSDPDAIANSINGCIEMSELLQARIYKEILLRAKQKP